MLVNLNKIKSNKSILFQPVTEAFLILFTLT